MDTNALNNGTFLEMSNERDNRLVDMAAWAYQNLEPINQEALQRAGLYMEAAKINTARVAVEQLARQLRHEEHRIQDVDHADRRLKFLLRKMFTADDEYGTGFHSTDKWREAYDALRAEIGMEVADR
jgi:hypothetical protein